jgi:hypothetical protein
MTPEHNLNIYNSSTLDRDSVHRAEITTLFATISEQLKYHYEHFTKYLQRAPGYLRTYGWRSLAK